MSSLLDSELRWKSISDSQDGSPLGKAAALVVERLGSGSKTVKTLGGVLTPCAAKHNEALVELDAGVDVAGAEELHEVLAVSGGLVDGLLKQNDSRNVILDLWRGEKQFTVSASVCLVVLNIDSAEALANGASRLVSGKDTLSSSADVFGGLDEFGFEGLLGVDDVTHSVGLRSNFNLLIRLDARKYSP